MFTVDLAGNTIGIWSIIGGYLVLLLAVGVFTHCRHRKNTQSQVESHFLAGRNIGSLVMVFTIYATTISGYSIFGFPGAVFRSGWVSVRWITGCSTSLLAFTVLSPRFYRISKLRKFVSPLDFVHDRYNSSILGLCCGACMIVASSMYVLAQCKAMGALMSGLSGGVLPAVAGAGLLGVLILICELLGGMRIVCFTDVIQGGLMIASMCFLLVTLVINYHSELFQVHHLLQGSTPTFENITLPAPSAVSALSPPTPSNFNPPSQSPFDNGRSAIQVSVANVLETANFYILTLSWGVNPLVVQRCFAARNEKSLRNGIVLSSVLTSLALVPLFLLGLVATVKFRDLPHDQADQVLVMLLKEMLNSSWLNYGVVSVLFGGILAAFMSTTDSCLNNVSCIVSLDFVKRNKSSLTEKGVVMTSKLVSFLILLTTILFSNLATDINLEPLMILQLNITLQTAPTYLLGLFTSRVSAVDLLPGMVTAFMLLMGSFFLGKDWRLLGMSIGMSTLVINCLIICVAHLLRQKWKQFRLQRQQEIDHDMSPLTTAPTEEWWDKVCKDSYSKEVDPFNTPEPGTRGIGYPVIAVTALILGLPWFSYSESPALLGIPLWVIFMLLSGLVSTIVLIMWAMTYWCDSSKQNFELVQTIESAFENGVVASEMAMADMQNSGRFNLGGSRGSISSVEVATLPITVEAEIEPRT
eukprot:TRINITY_DN57610_c0_g1_i1.p1 TRINITY_DN57610_c0_g1~~TRINITY_DN57610_c0_g1_i1.p1  ORF type:complete len:697 (-),score=-20.40 TRINITY_DN57610_c0_g1_i1:219-2309(-)